MKRVLIIAYYFPPSGGPGVQRVLKHVKYLPEFGWQPVVLTVSNGQYPARDESLLSQIPDSTIVERMPIYEPYDLYRLLTGKKPGTAIDVNVIKKDDQKAGFKEKVAEWIRATFFIPDARSAWLINGAKTAGRLVEKYNIQAIYSSSPPYTCSLIARNLKRKTKLPWIAGFRDPWTGFISSPKRWFLPSLIDRKMEFSVFNEADFVECAWEGIIKDAIGKYPQLLKEKFIHVPNGFDSDEFPEIRPVRNEKFTVTYTGSMYGRRNPASFFAALELLIGRGVLVKEDFLLKFIGRFGSEVEEMFRTASFRDSIEIISYIPHEESIKHLLMSDALLLVVDESKESEEIVPGKVYEYIGVRKPVIAIAPENSAISRLIVETNSGMAAHQSETERTVEIILSFYKKWKANQTIIKPNENEINKYERREAARKLGELLDEIV